MRRRTGHLRSPKKPGDLYIVEFSLNGERHYVSLPDSAGWNHERAERERAYLMEKVNRGEWRPAAPVVRPPAAGPPDVPRAYADVAAEALARQVKRLEDPDGRRARELEYELSIGLDILGPLPLERVDEQA